MIFSWSETYTFLCCHFHVSFKEHELCVNCDLYLGFVLNKNSKACFLEPTWPSQSWMRCWHLNYLHVVSRWWFCMHLVATQNLWLHSSFSQVCQPWKGCAHREANSMLLDLSLSSPESRKTKCYAFWETMGIQHIRRLQKCKLWEATLASLTNSAPDIMFQQQLKSKTKRITILCELHWVRSLKKM